MWPSELGMKIYNYSVGFPTFIFLRTSTLKRGQDLYKQNISYSRQWNTLFIFCFETRYVSDHFNSIIQFTLRFFISHVLRLFCVISKSSLTKSSFTIRNYLGTDQEPTDRGSPSSNWLFERLAWECASINLLQKT